MGWFEEGRLVAFIIGSLWDQDRLTTVRHLVPFHLIANFRQNKYINVRVVSNSDLQPLCSRTR